MLSTKIMKEAIEPQDEYNLVYDEHQDSQDNSTSLPSKESNLSMIQDKKEVITRRPQIHKKSLLSFSHVPPQRRGSRSCIEPLQMIAEEEKPIMGQSKVYRVFWYEKTLDVKYDIVVQTISDTTIQDFLQLVILEFNKQYEFLHNQLLNDGSVRYEFYLAKKSGKPDQDSPCFAPNVSLKQTNVDTFAIKLIQLEKPKLDIQLQVHYGQELFREPKINKSITTNSESPTKLTNKKSSIWNIFKICCQEKQEDI